MRHAHGATTSGCADASLAIHGIEYHQYDICSRPSAAMACIQQRFVAVSARGVLSCGIRPTLCLGRLLVHVRQTILDAVECNGSDLFECQSTRMSVARRTVRRLYTWTVPTFRVRCCPPNYRHYRIWLSSTWTATPLRVQYPIGWERPGHMSHLEIIDLDSNRLTGSMPLSLYQATALRVLDLDHNSLSGTIDAGVSNWTNLFFFQVDFKQLSGTIPSSLWTLSQLHYLSLLGNTFSAALPSSSHECFVPIVDFAQWTIVVRLFGR
jgi:Leucine-rich repeat (LRR) protein